MLHNFLLHFCAHFGTCFFITIFLFLYFKNIGFCATTSFLVGLFYKILEGPIFLPMFLKSMCFNLFGCFFAIIYLIFNSKK